MTVPSTTTTTISINGFSGNFVDLISQLEESEQFRDLPQETQKQVLDAIVAKVMEQVSHVADE